jgi:hypothetical protein
MEICKRTQKDKNHDVLMQEFSVESSTICDIKAFLMKPADSCNQHTPFPLNAG